MHKGEAEYMIALDELAGGTAADCSNHVFLTMSYLSALYSKVHDLNADEVIITFITDQIITFNIDYIIK